MAKEKINPPPRKRSRTSKGKAVLDPSERHLNGFLTFTKPKDKERYKFFWTKQVIPGKCMDKLTMETLNIQTDLLKLIENIKWESFFAIRYTAYRELVLEFYSTYEFDEKAVETLDTPNVISFRLMGTWFKLSVTQFNLAFGFISKEYSKCEEYLSSACDYPRDFDPYDWYEICSTDPCVYKPNKIQDSQFRDNHMIYVHRLLAYNFSGRKASSATVSKAEFFFLWCMQTGRNVNLGYWLALEFAGVFKHKRHLILGSLITQLAVHEKLIDIKDNNLHVACEMQPLDLLCLKNMWLIEEVDSTFAFYPPGSNAYRRGGHETDEDEDGDEGVDTGTSSRRHVATRRASIEYRLEQMENRQIRMELNQLAFFEFMKFKPPFPPPSE